MDALQLLDVRIDVPGRGALLDGVTLQVPAGRVAVVEGRSGAGKSSLLAVAAGLEQPASGAVRWNGVPAEAVRQGIERARAAGIVFQHFDLVPELTTRENIALPLKLHRVAKTERRRRTEALLEQFGLQEVGGQRPATLSGGEQQRTSIARAMAMQPALLLIDEPTSHLDDDNAAIVARSIAGVARAGTAVVVATHDHALRSLGRRFLIRDRRLVAA